MLYATNWKDYVILSWTELNISINCNMIYVNTMIGMLNKHIAITWMNADLLSMVH